MHSHEHYEGLCAAAVSGQIRPDELLDLKEHVTTCSSCRDFVGDAGAIVAQVIPELTQRSVSLPVKPAGMTDRFIARAHSQGIPVTKSVKSGAKSSKHSGWILLAAAAIIALGLAVAPVKSIFRREPPLIVRFGGHEVSPPLPPLPAYDSGTRSDTLRNENAELRRRLEDDQAQLHSLTVKLKSDQDALKVAAAQNSELSARLPDVERENTELQRNLAEREKQISKISQDLDRLEIEKEAGRIATEVEETELNTLRNKVGKLTTDLQESEQLSGAAKQARDLIVARNLHIVDVHDADERGNRQSAFGRIFYTEGKSLVFYAYDLADPRRRSAKIRFYVWGEKLGANNVKAKVLGVLHSDDSTEGRWVFSFDDANVLAQIDSVFVTVESDKQPIAQPTGKKILYAFLGDKPNHP